jgi:hypothetical protein
MMISDDDEGGESNTPTLTKNANVSVTSFASPSPSFLSSSAPCAGTAAGAVVACVGPVQRSLSRSFPTTATLAVTQNAIAATGAVSIFLGASQSPSSGRSSRSASASDCDSDPTMAEWTVDGGEGGGRDDGVDGTEKDIKKCVHSANNSRNLRPRSATTSSRTSSSSPYSKNATSKNTERTDGCTIDAVRRCMQPLLAEAPSTNSATTTATAMEVAQKGDECRQSGGGRGREGEDAQRRRWAARAGFVWLAVTTSCSAWAALVDNLPGLPAS